MAAAKLQSLGADVHKCTEVIEQRANKTRDHRRGEERRGEEGRDEASREEQSLFGELSE